MLLSIFLISEITIFTVFIGVVLAGGGGLYVYTANKNLANRESRSPNKDLINEKRAEIEEYELKPRPNKVISNHRQLQFNKSLEHIDLEKMSANNQQMKENKNLQNLYEELSEITAKVEKDKNKIDEIISTR